jgi:hypothetical protein
MGASTPESKRHNFTSRSTAVSQCGLRPVDHYCRAVKRGRLASHVTSQQSATLRIWRNGLPIGGKLMRPGNLWQRLALPCLLGQDPPSARR